MFVAQVLVGPSISFKYFKLNTKRLRTATDRRQTSCLFGMAEELLCWVKYFKLNVSRSGFIFFGSNFSLFLFFAI